MTPAAVSSVSQLPPVLAVVARRFPLLGRPRPSCPALPQRIHELADELAGHTIGGVVDGVGGAHALNKAALIASDCGLPDLARDLCWRHIDLYRAAARPLTVLHARYMLEPVLNLARLQLRAHDGDHALQLLTAMFQAVKTDTDLVVDGRTLPLAGLVGSRAERHQLLEWVWLHLVGDGVRALVLASRWDAAVAHAEAHRGIGVYLMDGRQALIVAHCLAGRFAQARAALADSTPAQPWELQVAACLDVLCTDPDTTPNPVAVTTMITRYVEREPMRGYAFFRAQLGLTVVTLAHSRHPDAADVFDQVVDEVIRSEDGYAAREVLRHADSSTRATQSQRTALTDLIQASGLGFGLLPNHLRQDLLAATAAAAARVRLSLSPP